MRKLLNFIAAAITVLTFTMCEYLEELVNPGVNERYFSTESDICIFKEETIDYICEISADGTSLVFDANTPNDALPKVGAHIYIPISEKTPYGVLAKVSSVNKSGVISVKIDPLSLDEAFEFLSIDKSTPIQHEFEGIFDERGEQIEYEVVDSTEINLGDTIVNPAYTRGVESFKFGSDCVKVPVKLRKAGVEVAGTAYIGFRDFTLDIDVANGLQYLNLNATPYVKIGLSNKVAAEGKYELSTRIGELRHKFIIPTPIPTVFLVFPVKLYVDGACGVSGELSASLGLQYEYNCKCVATFKNGNWSGDVNHGGFNNKSPWTVGEFDVNGEIYSKVKLGLMVGLYSSTAGIGFNIEPKMSLAAGAKLSSEDLLKTNPEVGMSLKVGSELYCAAKLFGMKLAKYSMVFPEYVLFSDTMYLLPNITDFKAIGGSTSADISWKHDQYYFLALAGVKTGTTIFESDCTTEVDSYTPSPTNSELGTLYYDVNAPGLDAGKTYYAAPFVNWGDYKWYGEKEEFTTEAGYKVMWRCEGREDIWSIDININANTTELNIPFEAATYDDGWTKRLLVATYNPSTGILTGTVETTFYDNPDDRRIDGFTADLTKDDTGYMTNSKVLPNGACYTQIRFVKITQQSQAGIMSLPLGEDMCGLGERIMR